MYTPAEAVNLWAISYKGLFTGKFPMATSKIRTHYRSCNLCEAICGIEIRLRGDEIISIRGDKKDPFSKGHICPKAVALQDLPG